MPKKNTQDVGIKTGASRYPECQGVDVQVEGEVLNSVVGHSNYRIEVQHVTFIWDIESDTMTEAGDRETKSLMREIEDVNVEQEFVVVKPPVFG